jgi:RNA polymerase sigma-70 factor (ECF subfamily)
MNPSEMTDSQVVIEVRERNKELFGEIIRRYQTRLTHYLRKFIRQSDELEDVLQVVFIKAYENLHGFDVSRGFSAWIYRIAHNEAINHIRKNARVSVSIDEVEMVLADESIDVPRDFDRALVQEQIEASLGKMKEKYREPLILFLFEEKTYEEISDILRVPTSTVGTLLARGKKILKEDLSSNGYGKQI